MTLEIHNVSKRFGGVKALSNCSLCVESGKITAIIGPNGSGKSTLFNVISRIITEDKGKILLEGKTITSLSDVSLAKKGISRTFQHVRLFPNLSIEQHLQIALCRTDEKMIHSCFATRRSQKEEIREILNLVGLKKRRSTLAKDLSYGQRKLLDLAMALAKPHSFLLLDEPVAGVNPKLRKKIQGILLRLRKEQESILLIEHDMHFVMNLADYIFVLDKGKLIAHGIPEEIKKDPTVLEAYLGD